jgi:hypothetical protein
MERVSFWGRFQIPGEHMVLLLDYYKLFNRSGFEIEAIYKPLGYNNEPYKWISETWIAPWMIFVLNKMVNFEP